MPNVISRLPSARFLDGFSCESAPFEEWVLLTREQTGQHVLRMLRHLTAHSEQCGDHPQAQIYARKQLELEPWDEEANRALMRSLAASGQRNAALTQFAVCRRLLKEEIGVEPSRETITLYENIRDGIFKMPAPTNVPVPVTNFVGREKELGELKELLSRTRLLVISGAGGFGKTRLALQVATELANANCYKDGVWWVDLAALNHPALVPQTVASVFDLRESPQVPILTVLVDYLRAKEMLLTLDNCEHLTDACAALAQSLLHACPHLQILATSRHTLGIGETIWRVPALALPQNVERMSMQQLIESDALRLFAARATAVAPHWRLDLNVLTVAQICARLDGIPLAIELTAARVCSLTAKQIAERLTDRFHLLTDASRMALRRHQTLRAAIDWSYELLSKEEQVLFRRLAVFAGGWTLQAAEQVASDEVAILLDLLTQLVNKSLVTVEERRGEARYRLLETIRLYSHERLVESGEAEQVNARHLEFFLQFAERAEPELRSGEQKLWLDRLDTEHDNLRDALVWARESGAAKSGLSLAAALGDFWWRRGYLTEGTQWLGEMLAASSDASAPVRAKALLGMGTCEWNRGNYETAIALVEESLTVYQVLGNILGIASALHALGGIRHFQGANERAVVLLEQSLALCRETGSRWGTAATLLWLADTRMRQGNQEEAAALWEESLALFRELGDTWGIGFALGGLGDVARLQGNYIQARAALEESLLLEWKQGNQCDIPFALEALAALAAAQGQLERAARLCGAADALRESISSPLPPSYRADYAPWLTTARAQMGESAFATAWSDGRVMSPEQIIEYTLG